MHIHTLLQLMTTAILNVLTNEEKDLEEFDILPNGTQVISGKSWYLNPDNVCL